jgi:hypothetical protein
VTVHVQRASNYTQPATTQKHNQNRTRGLPKECTPYGSKYNLNIQPQPLQSMKVTADHSQIYAYAQQKEDFYHRLLRSVTYSIVMQHVILTTVKITVNHQTFIFDI